MDPIPDRHNKAFQSSEIHDNWEFRQTNSDEPFRTVSQFPTNIHLDLLHHGLIPDPNILLNENDVQWVGEEHWTYRTTFALPLRHDITGEWLNENGTALSTGSSRCKHVLVLEGLDTFATVLLNGRQILKSDNMFVCNRVDITDCLHKDTGAINTLVIAFESASLAGKKIVERFPSHKWGCWNGDPSRLAVRKAQYSYGWDWGPTMLTAGPWKPIRLEYYCARIKSLYVVTTVREILDSADVVIKVDLDGDTQDMHLQLQLYLNGRKCCIKRVNIEKNQAEASFCLAKQDLALWYPRRYGSQPLYTIEVSLLHESHIIHVAAKKFGIRKAELIQRPLENEEGETFYFEVNNVPIFCGGSNWIPADNFLPRLPQEKYYKWVEMAAEGNQCMIRVWGGGIYEHDAFYDACDELGILVWQDFLFACGNYPTDPAFLASIEREAVQNVKRLRHHPSIVVWAGNNEDYQYAASEGLTYDFEDKDPSSWLKTDFPARFIYEKLLADVCKELTPDVPYHYGSPWSVAMKAEGLDQAKYGDTHQWNIWHGAQLPYQNATNLSARFISEFGMQALPIAETIDSFLAGMERERYSQSRVLDHHNKATGHEGRLALYLETNIRYKKEPLEIYIYATQLMQSECLTSCFQAWKRNWKGAGEKECGGVLVWQLNDVWPCTSWSIVDCNMNPKAGYYAIKREMQDISMGIKRTVVELSENEEKHLAVKKYLKLELWSCNLTRTPITVHVQLSVWHIASARLERRERVRPNLKMHANQTTEIAEVPFPEGSNSSFAASSVVMVELINSATGVCEAASINWPEPLKYIHFSEAQISIHRRAPNYVEILSDRPAKGVMLFAVTNVRSEQGEGINATQIWTRDDSVSWLDNCVDLVPGRVVRLGLRGTYQHLACRYLGMPDKAELHGQLLRCY